MMAPISMLDQWAKSRPRHVAFIARNEIWTYQRLAAEADRAARGFLARGVRPGDRVALHMANLPEMIVAYYACFRIGAIASPLNNRFKTSELKQVLQRLQPALYIGQAQLYPAVEAVDSTILPPSTRYIVGGAVDADGAQPWASLLEDTADISMPRVPDIDSPAVLLTTSGTTGQPKFVVHTPPTLSAISDTCVELGLQKDHVVCNFVPMVHASGLFVLLFCMRLGVQMILFERFDADAVLDGIEAYRCNWMVGLPFMYAALLETQWTQPRKIDSLRCCLTAGDVCPQQLQQEFPYAFGIPLRSVWAATETGSLTFGLQLGPVARVVLGAQIRLVDSDGESVTRGEVGELWIRGPNVTPGYWVGPGRIEDPTFGGWFPTGDLMRQGEGDDLWFVSRKKDLIIRGGSNISPVEVERVLKNHPAVHDAAVFGVPDAVLGERVAALVQLTGDASRAAREHILASAKAALADYKIPEQLEIVSEIPRNGLGKIDRKLLRAIMVTKTKDSPLPSERSLVPH
ncbi:MAG: acyl--CoA ligase [Acetobacteraceae bacterium]|nr:acyl--CoA ligase [Acetobacteraceae bacterium]